MPKFSIGLWWDQKKLWSSRIRCRKSDEMKMFLFSDSQSAGNSSRRLPSPEGGQTGPSQLRHCCRSLCNMFIGHCWTSLNIVIHCWILLNIVEHCWTLLRVSFQYVLICYNVLQLFEKCSIPNFCPSHRHSHQMFTAFSISYKFVSNQYFQYQISLFVSNQYFQYQTNVSNQINQLSVWWVSLLQCS